MSAQILKHLMFLTWDSSFLSSLFNPDPEIHYRIWLFLLWLIGSLFAAAVLSRLWSSVFLPLARKTRTTLDVCILQHTRRPVLYLVVIAGIKAGVVSALEEVSDAGIPLAARTLQGILYVAVVAGVTVAIYATLNAVAEWYEKEVAEHTATKLDDQFIALFRKLGKFVFLFIGLTIVLDHFGIQITGLIATAGVASLAIAFAAQETLSNMISGFVLMLDHPFRIGDRVELSDGKVGDVLDIGLRSTRILSFDNTVITIPNAEIAKNMITNHNAPTAQFKIRKTIGVAYGTDIRKVKRILMEIFTSHPDILKDPPPGVFFSEFGESSLNLLYICWVADYHQWFRILDEINMAIKDRFEAEGVEIPFPQRDVHFHGMSASSNCVSPHGNPASSGNDTSDKPDGAK